MDLNEHTISGRLSEIRSALPEGVRLVAVSKFHPVPVLEEAYAAGQRLFGENRPQEFAGKVPQLPGDIEWHFIGHLQTNKLKMVLPYATLVQSVDSVRLLEAIASWAEANDRTVSVLLELHLGAEETKHGLSEEEIVAILDAAAAARHSSGTLAAAVPEGLSAEAVARHSPETLATAAKWRRIRFCGLMGMATHTEDESLIRADFARISELFRRLRACIAASGDAGLQASFHELSIGMSGDWRIALEYGATLIRVGTAIFGEREY